MNLFDIEPQLTEVTYGPEPSLRKMVMHFYTSHDIPADKAAKMTEEYIQAITVKSAFVRETK